MRFLALALLFALGASGCAAPEPKAADVPSPNLQVRFMDDRMDRALANASVSATLVQCALMDDLVRFVTLGWEDCPRVRFNITTDVDGWWNATIDHSKRLEVLHVRPAGHAGLSFEDPVFPLTVRSLQERLTQVANFTADPGVWVNPITPVTEAQQKGVPFTVDPDPGVNQAYLDQMATFRIRIEWTNEDTSMAMLTAAYGNEGRIFTAYGAGSQEPYAVGPQVHEVERTDAREYAWPGFVVGFQTGWPVVATEPMPVSMMAEYTFGQEAP